MNTGTLQEKTDWAQRLSALGCRRSRCREAVLHALSDAQSPLSAVEILDIFSRGKKSFHKTTVYRDLEALEHLGIVEKFLLGDRGAVYELAREQHHHAVCVGCGDVQHVTADPMWCDQLAQVEQETGFSISGHAVEFSGRCGRCREGESL